MIWDDRIARPGWQQMAIDRALAQCAHDDGIIVYRICRWAIGTLSFGANEAALRTWDRARLTRDGMPCVRRPTGGRGVWHDQHDLTYSVTGPANALGGLRLAYRTIHDQLALAMRRLGFEASLAESRRRPTLEPGACFQSAVGGEVMIAGRKTIGSAQASIGRALLQHGAIICAGRRDPLARFRLESTTRSDAAPARLPAAGDIATAVVAIWQEHGGTPITPALIEQAVGASTSWTAHYQDERWTWRR